MGLFSKKRSADQPGAAAPAAHPERPRVEADPSWQPPDGDLLAVSMDQLASMTDAEQSRFEDLVRAEVANLKAHQKVLEADKSAAARQDRMWILDQLSALFKQLSALNYDRARREGKFDEKLGPHPRRWG